MKNKDLFNYFNSNELCDDIELSNFVQLDNSIASKFQSSKYNENFSNFRILGIGKPSKKQLEKWAKKNPKKVEKLIQRGVVTAPNELSGVIASVKSIAESLPIKDKTLKSQGYEESVVVDAVNIDDDSNKELKKNYSDEKKYLGMSKNTAIIVFVGIAVMAIGTFTYFKFIKK